MNDLEKAALYKQAEVFVLPSFYEGFGMPVLEAMSYHVPVVASDIPVLHEVAVEAALYCDPFDPDDIANTIAKILSNHQLRSSLIQKEVHQLDKFSWNAVAEQVYNTILKTVGKR